MFPQMGAPWSELPGVNNSERDPQLEPNMGVPQHQRHSYLSPNFMGQTTSELTENILSASEQSMHSILFTNAVSLATSSAMAMAGAPIPESPGEPFTSSSLTNHGTQHLTVSPVTGRPSKCYKCSYCTKMFGHKNDFRKHVAIHTGLKPHGCPHCSLSFTQRGTLKNHVRRIHKVDMPQ